jgi:hypothetical protein
VSEDALAAGLLARRLLLEPGNPYKFKTVDPDDRTTPVFGPRQSVIDEGKQDRMYSKVMTHSVDMGRLCMLIGDHVSGMLYDRANCPGNPWPTEPETVLAMMKYKCQLFGTPLECYGRDVFDPGTGEQVFWTGLRRLSSMNPRQTSNKLSFHCRCALNDETRCHSDISS